MLQHEQMAPFRGLIACVALPLSACFYNPTIGEEIAGKCGVSVREYKRADRHLNAAQDGASIRAGRCRLTRKSKDVIEGTVEGGS